MLNTNLLRTKDDFNQKVETLDFSWYKGKFLTIKSFPKLKNILIMFNEKTKEINIRNLKELRELEIIGCKLLEKLTITNCKRLEVINCKNNNLTKLDLSDCENLEFIELCNNYLSELILPAKNKIFSLSFTGNRFVNFDFSILGKSLEILDIYDNQLEGNLSNFSRLENLAILRFDNNNLHGSFKSLCNLNNLRTLSFHNNSIIPSFEWVSEKIIYWCCGDYSKDKLLYVNKVFERLSELSSSNYCDNFFTEIKLKDYEKGLEIFKKEILLERNFKSFEEFETLRKELERLGTTKKEVSRYQGFKNLAEVKLVKEKSTDLEEAEKDLLLYKEVEDLKGSTLINKDLENFELMKRDLADFELMKGELERVEWQFKSLKYLTSLELVREQLRLAFGKDQKDNKFYWTRNQLTENILTNVNNGFRLWLDSEILSLSKLRLDFYWNLIEEEETFKEEEFKCFFTQNC